MSVGLIFDAWRQTTEPRLVYQGVLRPSLACLAQPWSCLHSQPCWPLALSFQRPSQPAHLRNTLSCCATVQDRFFIDHLEVSKVVAAAEVPYNRVLHVSPAGR